MTLNPAQIEELRKSRDVVAINVSGDQWRGILDTIEALYETLEVMEAKDGYAALLKRSEKLERVAEAARDLRDNFVGVGVNGYDEMCEALSELDGKNGLND